jgi:phosphoserine aminotransferase
MIALSPRAVERLTTHKPAWPLPKVFRMTASGKLSEGIFKGETINTPSMLCVEDQLDALGWAEKIGGLKALIGRTEANVGALADWVAKSAWAAFLAEDAATRSSTSVCLKIVDPWFLGLAEPAQQEVAKQLASTIEAEGVGYDLGAYRDAPPGLRIWCGATVETSDIAALLPWLDWAYAQVKSKTEKAA